MTFDHTSNYLYYFDGLNRVIYNVKDTKIFDIITSDRAYSNLVASPKVGYEDITVGVSEGGNSFSVFDDYKTLEYYYGSYNMAAFCDTGDLLAIYNGYGNL